MAYKLDKLGEELDAALNRKLDRIARSPDLVAKFLQLADAGESKAAIISLAVSIVEDYMGEEKYPEIEDYAEAIKNCFSSMEGDPEEELVDARLHGDRDVPEDKWLIMASEILAIKVANFCKEEGLIAVDEGDRD